MKAALWWMMRSNFAAPAPSARKGNILENDGEDDCQAPMDQFHDVVRFMVTNLKELSAPYFNFNSLICSIALI